MAQRLFESDEDYAARMREEAAEKVIEDSTGSAPTRRLFESDEDYRSRVTQEANEHIVEDSTGYAPRQRLCENDRDYRTRVFEEANARVVEDATGSAPRKRLFEDDDDYRSRVFQESNEATIKEHTGSEPHQRIFENDGDYKRRVGLEAREFRARGDELHRSSLSGDGYSHDSTSAEDYGDYPSSGTSSSSSGGFIPLLVVIGIVVLIFTVVSGRHGQSAPAVAEQTSGEPEHQTPQGPLVRPFVGTGLIGVPNQDQQPDGTAAVPSSSENGLGAAQENALTIVLDSGNSKSIWTTSVYSYAPGGGGPGGGLDNDQLRIGGWGDEYWSLLQFDLSSAPKLADRATLQLYNEDSNATPTPFDVYMIDQDWGWTRGDRLWWRDRPTEMHRVLSVSAPQSNSWVSIDITDVYNNWQSGTPNFGIALRPLYTNDKFDQFRSSKFADETYRPKLLITVAHQSR